MRLLTQGLGKPVGKYTAVEYREHSVCLGVRKQDSRSKPPLGQAPHLLSIAMVLKEPERDNYFAPVSLRLCFSSLCVSHFGGEGVGLLKTDC